MNDALDDNRIWLDTVQYQMALYDFDPQPRLDFNSVPAGVWKGIDFLKCIKQPCEQAVRLPRAPLIQSVSVMKLQVGLGLFTQPPCHAVAPVYF